MMMEVSKLKPCPFCGGVPDYIFEDKLCGDQHIECTACGASTHKMFQIGGDINVIQLVIDKWNDRVDKNKLNELETELLSRLKEHKNELFDAYGADGKIDQYTNGKFWECKDIQILVTKMLEELK